MVLENLYISPLETCNLNCRHCYTKKTKNILSNDQILKFIDIYSKHLKVMSSLVKGRIKEGFRLQSIIFCGGEVFTLPDFPALVNQLSTQKIFITIITNGTIDRLSEINDPSNCQLLVSFDGPEAIHDQNRGAGNYQKSLDFVKHAQKLGFPVEIMFLITQDSYPYKDSFDILGLSKTYLTDRLHSLTPDQIIDIKTNYPTFPANNFGCSTLSLQSNGLLYGCCESSLSIGKITDPIDQVITKYQKIFLKCDKCQPNVFFGTERTRSSVSPKVASTTKKYSADIKSCHGCCDPTYLCDYIKDLHCTDCHQVLEILN